MIQCCSGVETLAEPITVIFEPPADAKWTEVVRALHSGLIIGRTYSVYRESFYSDGTEPTYNLHGRTGEFPCSMFRKTRTLVNTKREANPA